MSREMQTVIVVDSKSGNTETIATAIARGAGTLASMSVMRTAQAADGFVAARRAAPQERLTRSDTGAGR